MKLILAGGTGFLGRPLAESLAHDGHAVVALTRSLPPGVERHVPGSGTPGITETGWTTDEAADRLARTVGGADAVVNLAGESIAAGRWTRARKAKIRDSRLAATRTIVAAMRAASPPPPVLVNGSAVGYYGDRGAQALTETSASGSDFLAQVSVEWEREARTAEAFGTRVVLVRTGLVLERDGGALAKMLLPFRLFAGGPLGSGRQYMSWIHRADWLDLVRWAIITPAAIGPLNATAPNPVTNAEFSRALGRALGRPSWLPAPAFAMRLVLGEMADALLLGGQRVLPARAQELGFTFVYPQIDQALKAILMTS
jgi:uncharacterized protein (TIGR01777 family)